jgi:hypothetical protein
MDKNLPDQEPNQTPISVARARGKAEPKDPEAIAQRLMHIQYANEDKRTKQKAAHASWKKGCEDARMAEPTASPSTTTEDSPERLSGVVKMPFDEEDRRAEAVFRAQKTMAGIASALATVLDNETGVA